MSDDKPQPMPCDEYWLRTARLDIAAERKLNPLQLAAWLNRPPPCSSEDGKHCWETVVPHAGVVGDPCCYCRKPRDFPTGYHAERRTRHDD